MRRVWLILLTATALATVTGCHKATPGGAHLKQVNDALVAGGFKLDGFHPTDPARYGASSCATGPLAGLDALVCEYASPAGQALGKRASEDWIAQAVTGVVLQNGLTTLALADRAHADPNGRTIQRITQSYQQAK